MSSPGDNNYQAVEDIEDIRQVVITGKNGEIVYNSEVTGDDGPLLEGFDYLMRPQYEMIDEYGGVTGRQEKIDLDTYTNEGLDQLKSEMEDNWDSEFKVVLDTSDGEKEFYLQRNNDQRPDVQQNPYSSAVLESEDGQRLGFRVMRDYEDRNDTPKEWKKQSFAECWRPEENYEVQERDFLLAVDRPGGIDEQLRAKEGFVPIGRGNFVVAEDRGATERSFSKSNGETALIYDYSDSFAQTATNEDAENFGRYLATLDSLGLGRIDRDVEEFMIAEDSHVYETDHEKVRYGPEAGGSTDAIVDLLTKMARKGGFEDPREVQQDAINGFEEVKQAEEDLRHMLADSLIEWDPEEFRDERSL